MQQVLFYIPVQAGWLPDYFPLPALVAAVLLLAAAAVGFTAPKQLFDVSDETWKSVAKWLAGFGVAAGVGLHVAGRYWPDGIPVHGFGMMLFVAFLLCNWVGARLARDVTFLTVATGPNRGKDYLATNFPADERARRTQDMIQDIAVILFVGGLLGSRIGETPWRGTGWWEYVKELSMIWEGGLIFYGGAIGAVVAFVPLYLYLYIRRNVRIDSLKLADICAPPLALGLCLGRVGCLLNGCCYGQVACADCVVTPIHFPLSAMSRPVLVDKGYQTAAGFTVAENGEAPNYGVRVGQVAPHSAAANAGLHPGDLLVKVNGEELKYHTTVVNKGTPAEHQKLVSPLETLDLILRPKEGGGEWKRGEKVLNVVVFDALTGEEKNVSFTPYTIGLYPTQVYESISMFLLFWVLLAFRPLQTRDGQLMALMMIGYGVHRWLNELLRDDPRPPEFEMNVSIGLVVGGAIFLLGLWLWPRRGKAKK
jgi:phosphatidylglycerol---prolipoprotein diacylglyceryl transferase